MRKLVIEFAFEDDSDYDFYRNKFVDLCEQIADEATNKSGEDGEILNDRGRADGEIEVNERD